MLTWQGGRQQVVLALEHCLGAFFSHPWQWCCVGGAKHTTVCWLVDREFTNSPTLHTQNVRTKVPFTRKKPCKGPGSYGGPPAHDQAAKGGGGEMRGRGGTERGLEQMFSHTCWKRRTSVASGTSTGLCSLFCGWRGESRCNTGEPEGQVWLVRLCCYAAQLPIQQTRLVGRWSDQSSPFSLRCAAYS